MVTSLDVLVVVILISVSGLGLLLNVAFLIISIVKRKVTSKLDYRWFLYGLTFSDILYTANMAILQPYIILKEMGDHGPFCFYSGYLAMVASVASVMGQPLLSINRYFAMFHPELSQKYFHRSYCLAMICGVFLLALLSAYSFVYFNEYGRFEGICCIAVYKMKIWHLMVFFASTVAFSNVISLYCAHKISNLIKNQTNRNNDRQWRSKIKEAKFIITFIYIEVFVPLALEAPVFILILINNFVTPVPHVIMTCILTCFIIHGTTDPIVVFIVIKPYRRMVVGWWRKLLGKTVVNWITTINSTTHP